MYSHCPHCLTLFRVYPEQLAQARGQVRCGVCNYCFNALTTLNEHPVPPPVSTAAEGGALAHSKQIENNSPSMPAPAEERLETETAGVGVEPELAMEAAAKAAPATVPIVESMEIHEPVSSATVARDAWENSIAVSADIENIARPDQAIETQPITYEQPIPPANQAQPDTPPSARIEATLPDLGIIAAEPRPIIARQPSVSRLKTGVWATLNFVLILVLLGQYAYYNRRELAQYPELRPWLAGLCQIAACDTPLQRDVSRIVLANRSVESHPRHANALLINATLVNDADFPQPYPLLEIRFSDLNNQLVAGRRFRPSEYLATGTPLQTGMAPHQPVHIILEIADPGKDAVSFQFDLL
jgi:predicted Zn finger-like uncharacterized protein